MNVVAIFAILIFAAIVGMVVYNLLLRRYDPEGREAARKRIARETAKAERANGNRDTARTLGEAALKVLPIARDREQKIASELRRAGLKVTTGTYWAAEIVSTILGVFLGALAAVSMTNPSPAIHVLVFLLLAVAGAYAPRAALTLGIRRRRGEIEASLPGNLELLAVVVGAGQTVERGIKTVADRTDGPLSEEFAQVSEDVTYFGKSTPEALQEMADRCDTPAMSLFVAAVTQSLNVGSPIKDILKSQAAIATDNYYLKVEEQSNKIRTKMIVPTVLFILPPIFIISIGPMVIRLSQELPKMMGA